MRCCLERFAPISANTRLQAPFAGDTEQKIFQSVLKVVPSYPSSLRPEGEDIMKKVNDPLKSLIFVLVVKQDS
jgi:hypothetical protein